MAENNKFSDPLDSIFERIKNGDENSGKLEVPKINDTASEVIRNGTPEIKKVEPPIPPTPIDLSESIIVPDEEKKEETKTVEVNYGEDDLENELKEIEEAEAAERAAKIKEAAEAKEANKPRQLPPEMYDMKEVTADVAHQANKQLILAEMCQKVAQRYKLPSGGVPEKDPRDKTGKTPLKFHVMGELMACYEADGEVITPKFEAIILNNWYLDSGITGRQFVENGYQDITNNTPEKKEPAQEKEVVDKQEEKVEKPSINIKVQPNTPVTVNVDKDLVGEMNTKEKVIDINVIEVTEEDMRRSTVVTNSDMDGIITPYDPGVQDIPVTLPVSGYKVILRPISWFESVAIVAPTARNAADVIIKQWSIIYKHIKWTSIGMFKDFDDFLSKTKYVDFQFFLWALLVASEKNNQIVTVKCGNKDCEHQERIEFNPRDIIRINEELIPAYYSEVDKASPGEEAVTIFNRIWSSRRIYELPSTKSIVEFASPSAKEFLDVKLPRMRLLFERYYPDQDFDKAFPTIIARLQKNELTGGEFAVLFGAATLLSSASVVRDGKEYRYTKWDAIEQIIMEHLDYKDSYLLFNNLFGENADIFTTPVSFWLPGFNCPECGRQNEDTEIDDIGQSLLFLLSLRYENTKINLIEQQKKS